MNSAIGKVFLFFLLVLGTFLLIGNTVTNLTGGERKASGKVEISPEGGETIFWGKGRCFTCHSLGDEGSAIRCPNLGQFGEKFLLPIGERASQRAKERSEKTGKHYTPTDYLIESLAKPDAYIVDGYKNEMAIVYAPPISLNLDEIKAVISYLQSQGGDLDLEAINNPTEIGQKYFARIEAATAAGGGDPGNGEEMYADNCMDCHILKGEGDEVGPDLSNISQRGLKFIAESILYPAKKITKGYETYIAIEKDGRKHVGIKARETATEIDIIKATGETVTLLKDELKEITEDKGASLMPVDLTEALTVKDYQDILAYLMMQKQATDGER